MKKTFFTLFLALYSFVSNSQDQLFSYTFSVDTITNTESSKDVLTVINKEFEMMEKRITGSHQFSIQSIVNTSEEVFEELLNTLGYQLTGFSKILEQEFYYTPKTEPGGVDCETASIVCSNDSFNGTASGHGTQELSSSNDGCLDGENQSSWYYINIQAGGSLEMTIDPTNSDDYDFAIWGPYTAVTAAVNCPPTSLPTRCNYAAYPRFLGCGTNTVNTGLAIGQTNTTSDDCQNRPFLAPLTTLTGEIYIMVVDNYSSSGDPYNLTWGGTADLDCTPVVLPVELSGFNGENIENKNRLKWSTASEMGNDYFLLERSVDNETWNTVDNQSGAGHSTTKMDYYFDDYTYRNTLNYYRLSQVDFNGKVNQYKTISVDNGLTDKSIVKIVNMLGQDVSKYYSGARVIIYSDGSRVRKIGN